jgi:hypothetical protein
MRPILLCCLACCSLGCRTLNECDFAVDTPREKYLPHLQAEADLHNLQSKIGAGHLRLQGHYNATLPFPEPPDTAEVFVEDPSFNYHAHRQNPDYDYTTAAFEPDSRISDLLKLFGREAYSMMDTTGQAALGTLRLQILEFEERKTPVLRFITLLTLGIYALIGQPVDHWYASVRVKVYVEDRQGRTMAAFEGTGEGDAAVGMYWSYGEDADRKALMEAFKQAMSEIKGQIRMSKSEISARLHRQ